MARLIRANSETPNVANNDDFRLLRYATGGYNGVLENYGNECNYTITGSDFKINSGVIIYQGVDSEILTAGDTVTVVNIVGTQYYSVYLEIDLSDSANQTAIIKSDYETSDYPVISAGDDLTTVPTGLANFELYRFTASSGVISNVVQRFSLIEVGNVLHAENADLATNSTNATNDSDGNPINTTYVKDSDFNTSSQTAFGDYIVEKKIIVLSTPIVNTLASAAQYIPIDFPSNSIFENNVLFVLEGYMTYRLGGTPSSTSSKSEFIIKIKTSNINNARPQGLLLLCNTETHTGDGLVVTYNPIGLQLYEESGHHRLVFYQSTFETLPTATPTYLANFVAGTTVAITKIYKIIE